MLDGEHRLDFDIRLFPHRNGFGEEDEDGVRRRRPNNDEQPARLHPSLHETALGQRHGLDAAATARGQFAVDDPQLIGGRHGADV